MEYCEQARKKLADEEQSFSGGQKEKIVYKDVSRTLQSFCSEEWFANAILQSSKTLSDCCKEIMSHVHWLYMKTPAVGLVFYEVHLLM